MECEFLGEEDISPLLRCLSRLSLIGCPRRRSFLLLFAVCPFQRTRADLKGPTLPGTYGTYQIDVCGSVFLRLG